MRKSTFSLITLFAFFSAILVLSSCKDDSYLTVKPSVKGTNISEEFDTATAALSRGWKFINRSEPIGAGVWQQGGGLPPWFPAYSSNTSNVGFIGADYTSTSAAAGVISNWVVSPSLVIQNGDKIVFYTRTQLLPGLTAPDSTDYANRMEVRINTHGDDFNVGSGTIAGNFDQTLLVINPNQLEYHTTTSLSSPYAYPGSWTRFEATVSGLNQPITSRFAFRYFITDAGSNGRGSGIALDKVSFISSNPSN